MDVDCESVSTVRIGSLSCVKDDTGVRAEMESRGTMTLWSQLGRRRRSVEV